MRILINDFGGYPFPMQLSRFLANNGYTVLHTYVSNIKTPHGDMEKGEDSGNLEILPIILNTEFKKYSFLGRLKGEYEFAKRVSVIINSFKPDIFLSANTPLLAQSILLDKCKQSKIKFIYWCQDIHSIAIENYLKKRLLFLGKWMSIYLKNKEIRLLEQSDHVITISDSFNDIFKEWGISRTHLSVIQNWAPVNEITIEPKINSWSTKFGVDNKLVVLYSGTLGLKHNPMLISNAAKRLKNNEEVIFVVISEGIGAQILIEQKKRFELNNLLVLPYQDYDIFPKVLGGSDILLSILEENASLFSVPSKVLTYLCAQKAILLSVPLDNLSAKIVTNSKSGYCVEPVDVDEFIDRISELIDNSDLRKKMGKNGRKYAEENFEISEIANKFIKIFKLVTAS
jgi:colanic acid biosynthesis glycosyl transferase WcaI